MKFTVKLNFRQFESDRLDRLALCTLSIIFILNLVVFPIHRDFLFPSELYINFPAVTHPFREYWPRSRNLEKLTFGIENSAATYNLPSSGKLFCFVETSEKYYEDRVPSVASTWLPRCDNGRFFSKTPVNDATLPFSTVYKNMDDSYYDLFRKTIFGFYYSYAYISKDFDWYMKADDDNYFVIDRLKKYLDTLDPTLPYYLGYRLKPFLKEGYNSGGSGYILSNAAVRMFVEFLYHDEKLCPYDWAEDRGMGRCLASMGIYPSDTRDEEGMNRFNAFHPKEIEGIAAGYHYYPLKNGSSISEKFISLHRISPLKMKFLDKILYPRSGQRLFTLEFLKIL